MSTGRVRLQSTANAVRATNFFKKAKSSTDMVRSIHNRSLTSLLEDFADTQHHLPPHHHATEGNLEALEDMVQTLGLTLRECDRNLSTLLHHAAKTNQVCVIKYLLDNRVDIDAVNCSGDTPLHIATREGHAEVIDILMNAGASTSIHNKAKDTPLHTAARDKTGQALKAILQHSVDMNARGYRNRTLLHVIAEVDNIEGLKVLCHAMNGTVEKHTYGAVGKHLCCCTADDDGLTSIHLAARKNSYQVMESILVQCKVHTTESMLEFMDTEKSNPLHVAIDAGSYEVVCVLLRFGACPLTIKNDIPPPLHMACSQGRLEMVKAMVDSHGVNILSGVDSNKKTPLHYSAFSNHSKSIISYIVEEGGDRININQQDVKGKTPLHISISLGNLTSVKELLSRKADLFVKDSAGHNALHFAVLYSRKAIIQAILEVPDSEELASDLNTKGYSPIHIGLKLAQRDIVSMLTMSVQLQPKNVKDPHGNSYIHLAASNGDWNILSSFLELRNAHKLLNEANKYGGTPLHYASKNGHVHCVEILLNSGAMAHRCHKGMSPLMAACRDGHIECAKLLYKAYPYQIDWQDEDGDTALHFAARSRDPSMVQQVLDLGAQILLNDEGKSFLNIIIRDANEDCGLAVVNHRRWQECLDVLSPSEDDPMLGLVKQMPTIAKAVLNRSHTKEQSNNNQPQQHHTETFNFKYLLTPDHEGEQATTSQLSMATSMPPRAPEAQSTNIRQRLTRSLSRKNKQLDEVAITDLELADTDMRLMTFNHKRSLTRTAIPASVAASSCSESKKTTSQSMEVLKRMIQYKRVDLLVHPVVSAYFNEKWRLYGRYIYSFYFFNLIALVASLSLFVIVGFPAYQDYVQSVENNTQENGTTFNNSDIGVPELGAPAQTFRALAAILNTVKAMFTIKALVLQTWKSITLVDRVTLWNSIIATILNYAFLLSPNPFHEHILPIDAAACFFTWLVLFGALEFINVLGVYVNMFFKILRTVFQVFLACIILLMAFAVSIYLLASRVAEFSNVGFSLVSVFGYMLGEIQYSLFIKRAANDGTPLEDVVIVFILLLAIMMSIVMANLLIGLAVGDIEQIKLNALHRRRTLEVGYYTALDTMAPKCLRRITTPKTCTVRHNENLSFFKKLTMYTMRLVKSDQAEETQSAEGHSTAKAPVNIAQEMVQIKQKLKELTDMMHSHYDSDNVGRKKIRRMLRWQKPQSVLSFDSNDADLSMTASDFLADHNYLSSLSHSQ